MQASLDALTGPVGSLTRYQATLQADAGMPPPLECPWKEGAPKVQDLARASVRPVLTLKDREQFVTAGPDGDRAEVKRIRDRMLRTSCAYFAQEMLSEPFIVGKFHAEWDKLAYENKRVCILAARDHGKSAFWSFAFPIWRAFNHRPSLTRGRHSIFIFSATAAQAEIILENIRTELETNPKLQHLVPTHKTRGWSSKDLRCANGYWIRARGYGTKVRGGHPQDIVVDDGLNDETIYSPTVRQKQIDYFLSAITNMVHPKGRIVVVGTPFTVDDLYGVLAENPAYAFRAYPAITSEGLALFPERYSLADLEAKKVEIGPIRFAREFLCQALHDDMSLFPHRLFVGDPVEQPLVKLGMPLAFWLEAGIVGVYTGVDFALSASVGADFTVIFTIGLDNVGNRWILDLRKYHGMPYQEQKSKIIEVGRLYQPGLIVCEDNQAQRIFGDALITETDLPILPYTTGAEKHALDKGVPGLRILFENRKYRIPRGDAASVELTNEWAHQLTAFTWHDGKLASLTGHDDLVMANWLCEVGIARGAFTFSMGLDTMVDPAKAAQKLTVQQAVQQAAGKPVGPAGPGPVLAGAGRPPAPAGPPPPPVPSRPAGQIFQSFSRAGLPPMPSQGVELGPLGFPKLPGDE